MPRVNRRDPVVIAVVTVLLLLPPLFLSEFDQFVAISGLIMAIAILGLGVVTGRAGLISLAQLSFMAVGAWVVMYLQVHSPGMPFLLKLAVGTLAAIPVGILLSLPALRLRGINLGVVTLAFAAAVSTLLTIHSFPGATTGVFVERSGFLTDDRPYYWFCAVVFVVLLLGVTLLGRTAVGSSWSAVRESERATAALGRNVALAKMSAFAVSALCGGAAGSLLAGQLGTASPESFSPLGSLSAFALAIMMGARYAEGALLGGALYAFMPQLLQKLGLPQDVGDVLFGVGAILGLKRGFGAAEDIRDVLHRRSRGEVVPLDPPDDQRSGPSFWAPEHVDLDGAAALEIRGLSQSYGPVRALDDVSFSIPAGTVTALIGPNGAGKSTLIDCVTGFIRDYRGTVAVGGSSLDRLSAHQRARSGVRRSFQQGRTISDLSVEQYIRLGLSRSQRAALRDDDFDELLGFFGCPARGTSIRDIDVGTRQLLEVAAAVAARPSLVLLDEPAAGLGGAESVRLAHQIAEIPSRFGSAVLLVEHDIELVTLVATQLVVLDFGTVIATGSPEAVLADPQVINAYLGEEVVVP